MREQRVATLKYIGVVLAVLAAVAQAAVAQDTLTYVALIKRLTDLQRLAVLLQPGEPCAQWSSYDRHSKYDEATGKYAALGRQRRRRARRACGAESGYRNHLALRPARSAPSAHRPVFPHGTSSGPPFVVRYRPLRSPMP